MESTISDMWDEETGVPTVDKQREFNLFVGTIDDHDVYVRAHVDGVNGKDMTSLREYKKFRDSTWGKFLEQGVECQPNYPWQVSVAMHAMAAGYKPARQIAVACEFVGGRYHGDDDTGRSITEVVCKYLATPPIPLNAIRVRVARIERLINQGFDLPEVPCNAAMYPCPYYRYHDPKAELHEMTLPADAAWNDIFTDYMQGRASVTAMRRQVDEFDATVKAMRQQIIDRLLVEGVKPGTKVNIGDYEAKWQETERAEYVVKASVVTKVDIKKAS